MAGRPRLLPLFKEATLAIFLRASPLQVCHAKRASFNGCCWPRFQSTLTFKTVMVFSPLKDRLRHFDPFGTEFCEAGAGQPFACDSFQFLVFSFQIKAKRTCFN
jgi:hypothetical protein